MKPTLTGSVSTVMTAAAKSNRQSVALASIALFMAANCLANPTNPITDCEKKALSDVYGTYVYDEPRMRPSKRASVEEIYEGYEPDEAYQPGLSDRRYTGSELSIDPVLFQDLDDVVVNPYYVISCYRAFVEGHIPPFRWSDDYGFGVDREVIDVLTVYPPGDIHRQSPVTVLEIVGNDLWYGGFTRLYIARRKE